MKVVVYAQDLSGRRDDGHYTKPDIDSALDLFFSGADAKNYLDDSCEEEMSREDAEGIFSVDRRVTFYNESGEKTVIAADASAA